MAGIDRYHGILPLHKPVGMTSHDAVQKVRQITRQRGTGHTGTLDPLAEGLLLLCLGRATKIVRFLTDLEKCYVAEIRLGIRSETFDAEGVSPDAVPEVIPALSRDEILAVLSEFEGTISQHVPAYSAVRVDGERLYKKARKGESSELPEREITISRLELLHSHNEALKIEVACSKGTYIRSLANDIGERIGCGAYLASLVRTRVGHVDLAQSLAIEQVDIMHQQEQLESRLLPIESFLPYGAVWVTDQFSESVTQGRSLNPGDVTRIEGTFDVGDRIVLKNNRGLALAVGTAGADSQRFRSSTTNKLFTYMRVLN